MHNTRRIKLPHLYNFRDLGGYEGENGRVTQFQRIYRSDCPAELDDSEWERLKGLGIRTLIDLRSTYEAWETPLQVPEDFTYISMSFFREQEGVDLKGEAGKKFLESLSLDYCVMAENAVDRIVKILDTVRESLAKGNVMFFCTAGKDRTGIISAELLKLCGVSEEDITADYSVSEIYNACVIKKRIAAIPKEILAQVSPETMAQAADSKPETMRRYLAWAEEFALLSKLERSGFTGELQKDLKEKMLG